MEYKSFDVEVKADDSGTFEGYAATFLDIDSYNDSIQAGAFSKTIGERKSKVKLLWNHDSNMPPIGKVLDLKEDSRGLQIVAKLAQTPRAQEVHMLMREGAVDTMSIGYNTIKADYKDDVRLLRELKLFEVSPVNFEANSMAIITGVKSMSDLEHEIKRWTAIAQVGMSAKAGRTLSGANAKKILSALQTLQDLLTAAGVDDAATSTSDNTTAAKKGNAEPHESKDTPHSPLLTALQHEAKRQNAEGRKAALLGELRAFGQTLGA